MWWFRAAAVALALSLAPAGCAGYRWVAEDTPAPGAAKVGPLAVAAFANQTLEPYLGPRLTAAVRDRLLERGVVIDGGAPRRLAGRVTDFSDEVLAFDAAGIASHRRIVIATEIDLTDGDKPLWSKKPLVVSAEYPVTTDTTGNRDAKERALDEAAADLAEDILLDLSATDGGP